MLRRDTLISLCRARDMLRETHDRSVSIECVAREAAMSPYHFIRRFSAVFGETPHQFRIRTRLERAKHLLARTDSPVTEVCLEVGFTSLGSFSDLFARRVGVAPSVYRRKVWSLAGACRPLSGPFPGCFSLMCGDGTLAIFEKHSRRAARQTCG